MMVRIKTTRIATWAVGLLLLCLQVASGQDIIDRRDEARKWVLSSPETIYAHYCAHCHGEDGRGGGRLWPTELSTKPADLTSLGESEDYLIAAIREGSGVHDKSNLCPPWGRTISAINTQRLARYLLALGGQVSAKSDSPDVSQTTSASQGVEEPFPWTVALFIVAEIVFLLVMFRNKRGGVDHVRQNTAMRG